MGDAEAAKPPSKGALEGSATAAPVRALAHAWRYRAAVLALFAAFNLVTFNRYFPLSEGWWETYGYLWNSGLRPYRDFELAFTPLFTMVNAGLLRVFGDSFFALRLFGVGVFLLAVLVVELLLERFFSARMAAAAVTVSTFLAVAGPQFIAKDYHWYELGLVALALLVHVRVAEGRLAPRARFAGTFLDRRWRRTFFFRFSFLGGFLILINRNPLIRFCGCSRAGSGRLFHPSRQGFGLYVRL